MRPVDDGRIQAHRRDAAGLARISHRFEDDRITGDEAGRDVVRPEILCPTEGATAEAIVAVGLEVLPGRDGRVLDGGEAVLRLGARVDADRDERTGQDAAADADAIGIRAGSGIERRDRIDPHQHLPVHGAEADLDRGRIIGEIRRHVEARRDPREVGERVELARVAPRSHAIDRVAGSGRLSVVLAAQAAHTPALDDLAVGEVAAGETAEREHGAGAGPARWQRHLRTHEQVIDPRTYDRTAGAERHVRLQCREAGIGVEPGAGRVFAALLVVGDVPDEPQPRRVAESGQARGVTQRHVRVENRGFEVLAVGDPAGDHDVVDDEAGTEHRRVTGVFRRARIVRTEPNEDFVRARTEVGKRDRADVGADDEPVDRQQCAAQVGGRHGRVRAQIDPFVRQSERIGFDVDEVVTGFGLGGVVERQCRGTAVLQDNRLVPIVAIPRARPARIVGTQVRGVVRDARGGIEAVIHAPIDVGIAQDPVVVHRPSGAGAAAAGGVEAPVGDPHRVLQHLRRRGRGEWSDQSFGRVGLDCDERRIGDRTCGARWCNGNRHGNE